MYNLSIREKLNNKNYQGLSLSQSLTEVFSGRGKRYIVVIEAYFDESGTHRGAKILCVACYGGDRERWNSFEKEWQGILDKSGISLFHAKNPACDKLRPYLVKAILNADLKGIVCSVNPATFKIHAGAQLRSTLGNPYSICALSCGSGISRWRLENELEPVSIFLESGQTNSSHVEKIFKLMIDDPIYPISGVAVVSKKDYLPLQAADFLTHVYSTQDNDWLSKLNSSGHNLYSLLTTEQIIKISGEIKALYSRQRNTRKRLRKEARGLISIH